MYPMRISLIWSNNTLFWGNWCGKISMKEKASVMIIRELKDDGTLVQETFMHRK